MTRLAYACVLTRNLPRLADFYREVLQTEPVRTRAYAEFATGASLLGLWSLDEYAEVAGSAGVTMSAGGNIMLEFEVADVDAEFDRLQSLPNAFKIEFIIPPTTMAWGNRSIYFRDPDGNLLNLFSPVASAASG